MFQVILHRRFSYTGAHTLTSLERARLYDVGPSLIRFYIYYEI
jgi:hypothetical protein